MPTTTLPSEHIEDLTAHEWCNALLSDPTITHVSGRQSANKPEGVSDTLFTRTLFTPTSIRAFLSLYRPGSGTNPNACGDQPSSNGGPHTSHDIAGLSTAAEAARQLAKRDITFPLTTSDAPEVFILASIGSDVDSAKGLLHGGIAAALLDQAMVLLLQRVYGMKMVTRELTVRYLKAVATPCVLLVRARVRREKGRWIEAVGWLEDGVGTAFSRAEGGFVLHKAVEMKL